MVDFAEPVRLWAASTVSQKLAEKALKHEKKSFEQTVPACYHQFQDVFAKQAFDELPERWPWDHVIELVPGAEPVHCKVYPLNLDKQKQLDAVLAEHLSSGRIRPSKSPMASPFLFVKKEDGLL